MSELSPLTVLQTITVEYFTQISDFEKTMVRGHISQKQAVNFSSCIFLYTLILFQLDT